MDLDLLLDPYSLPPTIRHPKVLFCLFFVLVLLFFVLVSDLFVKELLQRNSFKNPAWLSERDEEIC